MTYLSPISFGEEAMAKVKVLFKVKVGETSRSRSLDPQFWYPWKGLVTRNEI